jgi:hypothetical protein
LLAERSGAAFDRGGAVKKQSSLVAETKNPAEASAGF